MRTKIDLPNETSDEFIRALNIMRQCLSTIQNERRVLGCLQGLSKSNDCEITRAVRHA